MVREKLSWLSWSWVWVLGQEGTQLLICPGSAWVWVPALSEDLLTLALAHATRLMLHEEQYPAKLALSTLPITSSSPPDELQPRHAPRLHKTMMFYFILPFIQTSRQFSATHGAGPALARPTSWGQLWGEQAQRPRLSPPACPSLAEGVDGGTEITSTWRHI